MHATRALALGLFERSPFTPPHRPQGPARRPMGKDAVSSLIRSFRIAIAASLDEALGTQLPRLSRYPY